MSAPIWFLDIDGVVNAFGDDLPAHLVATSATTEGIEWLINYDPDVIAFINRIHRDGLAEVRWLTTWASDARSSLAPAVGLDDLHAYPMHDSRDWWKAELVVESIAVEGRPVVWTDDDLTAQNLAELDAAGVPALGIATDPSRGLVAADLDRIGTFLDQPRLRPDRPTSDTAKDVR